MLFLLSCPLFQFVSHCISQIISRFPFNWKNPCGYLIAFSLQYAGVYYLMVFACCFVNFFVEVSFILSSMIEDVKEDMRPLQVENGKGTVEDFRQKLFDFMDLYSGIRELS